MLLFSKALLIPELPWQTCVKRLTAYRSVSTTGSIIKRKVYYGSLPGLASMQDDIYEKDSDLYLIRGAYINSRSVQRGDQGSSVFNAVFCKDFERIVQIYYSNSDDYVPEIAYQDNFTGKSISIENSDRRVPANPSAETASGGYTYGSRISYDEQTRSVLYTVDRGTKISSDPAAYEERICYGRINMDTLEEYTNSIYLDDWVTVYILGSTIYVSKDSLMYKINFNTNSLERVNCLYDGYPEVYAQYGKNVFLYNSTLNKTVVTDISMQTKIGELTGKVRGVLLKDKLIYPSSFSYSVPNPKTRPVHYWDIHTDQCYVLDNLDRNIIYMDENYTYGLKVTETISYSSTSYWYAFNVYKVSTDVFMRYLEKHSHLV